MLKWKKQDGASYYKVYRVKKNTNKSDFYPKKSKYQKIATVKSANFKYKKSVEYTDKKTKSGVEYAYYINSYSKDKKLLGTSFYEDSIVLLCSGLGAPHITNIGAGEFYTNSPMALHITVTNEIGVTPSGYIIYRKAAGDKKYIKLTKLKAKDGYCEYHDKDVKSGKTYYYKAKAYYTAGKKTSYSKKSDKKILMAVNHSGSYKANYLSTKDNEITFSLSSKKNNADTIVKKGIETIYFDELGGMDKDGLPFNLTQYSFDNKTWEIIPDMGVTFKAGKTIYLKGTSEIPAGYKVEKAIIDTNDNIIYNNLGGGCFYIFTIDFSANMAMAYPD
ncbi:MAG: hypothetical protein K6G88_00320 [Lachnospiraceae bacterium]|nr:hypothetical protein [Lachnospiraceae bacterium]